MAVNNKKELSKLSKNLNLIFTSPVFANALKAPAFQVIIEKQLNILNFLESKNSVTKPITPDFIIKYNTITAKKFSIDSKVNYADLGEMVDDINYLEVYIKNIYKIDLTALADGKESKIIAPTTSDVQQAAPKNTNPMNMMSMMMGGNQPDANFFAMQKVNMRMQTEIKSGKIYLFKSKPKFIPWAKLCLSLVFALSFLSALFLGVALIVVNGNISNNVLYDGGDSSGGSYLWTGILFIVFSLSLALYAVWTGLPLMKKYIKHKVNDNEVYYLSWQPLMILVFFIAFILITATGPGGIFRIWTASHHGEIIKAATNGLKKFGVWTWYVSLIALWTCIGLGMIAGITGTVLNPKQDVERLQEIQKQYMQEIIDQGTGTAVPTIPTA